MSVVIWVGVTIEIVQFTCGCRKAMSDHVVYIKTPIRYT